MRPLALPLALLILVALAGPAAARPAPRPVPVAACLDTSRPLRVAVFDVRLDGGATVAVPRGPRNRVRGGVPRAPVPTLFRPGPTAGVVRVAFPRSARRILWTLAGRTAEATARTRPCPRPRAVPQPAPPAPATSAPTENPGGPLAVSSPSGLTPAWQAGRRAYVTRCDGDTLQLDVEAPPAEPVSVAGRAPQAGRFTTRVPLAHGQAVRLTAGGTTYAIRCLPADFPDFSATRTGTPQARGYLVTAGNYVIVFDDAGVPVWWYGAAMPVIDAKLIGGRVVFARYYGGGFGTDPDLSYEVRDWSGQLEAEVRAVGAPTDHHELVRAGNGNWMVISYVRRDGVDLGGEGKGASDSVYDAEIQEITPDGQLAWSWNSKDHIAPQETGRWWGILGGSPWDSVHMNSVEATADGNVLFSARHLDAIYKISRATGEIIWKLGGSPTPQSLTVVGDDHQPLLGAQHDARELPDGTITVHDNRTGLTGAPRAARFAVDEQARTATLVEQVTDPAVPTSACCGSARRLSGGDWVMSWGGVPRVAELTPGGEVVFSLKLPAFSYRADPLTAADVTDATLEAGMDAQYPGAPG